MLCWFLGTRDLRVPATRTIARVRSDSRPIWHSLVKSARIWVAGRAGGVARRLSVVLRGSLGADGRRRGERRLGRGRDRRGGGSEGRPRGGRGAASASTGPTCRHRVDAPDFKRAYVDKPPAIGGRWPSKRRWGA